MGKNLLVGALGLVSLVYLFNPGMGIFELIPDNVPIIGNLDEAAAAALLIAALRHFGIDFTKFFSRKKIKDVPK